MTETELVGSLFLLFSSSLLFSFLIRFNSNFFCSSPTTRRTHLYIFKSYNANTQFPYFLLGFFGIARSSHSPPKNNAASTLIFRCPDVLNTSLPPFEIGRDLSAILRFRDSFAFSHLRRQTRRRSRRQGRRRGRRRSNRPLNILRSPLPPLLSQRINNVPLQRLNEWLSRHQKTRSPPGRMFFLLFS